MGPGSVRAWLTLVLGGATTSGCGGASEAPSERGESDYFAPSSVAASGVRPNEAPSDFDEPEPAASDREEAAAFIEQGCDEAPMRVVSMECDPFQPLDDCSTGQGCQPYVQYPSSPCEPEIYGSRCDWVGDAVQGESCSSDACAAGFLCIATGQGTQCAQICDLSADSGCPPGLVCGSIDIEGIGTCF